MTTESEPICCPEFDPLPWDDKTTEWENRKFIKDRVCTLFYMPIGFGRVMKRLFKKVENAGAETPGYLCLSEHTSKWNMDVYLAVDKEIPGAENTTLSGTYYSRVYEGPFKDTGKWHKDFAEHARAKGFDMRKWYSWYTTCPKCAKKYGKNYVVLFSRKD